MDESQLLIQQLLDDHLRAAEWALEVYIAQMRERYDNLAFTYHTLKNGRVRGTMRTLDGKQRRVFADDRQQAARKLIGIVWIIVLAQQAGVKERTYRELYMRQGWTGFAPILDRV